LALTSTGTVGYPDINSSCRCILREASLAMGPNYFCCLPLHSGSRDSGPGKAVHTFMITEPLQSRPARMPTAFKCRPPAAAPGVVPSPPRPSMPGRGLGLVGHRRQLHRCAATTALMPYRRLWKLKDPARFAGKPKVSHKQAHHQLTLSSGLAGGPVKVANCPSARRARTLTPAPQPILFQARQQAQILVAGASSWHGLLRRPGTGHTLVGSLSPWVAGSPLRVVHRMGPSAPDARYVFVPHSMKREILQLRFRPVAAGALTLARSCCAGKPACCVLDPFNPQAFVWSPRAPCVPAPSTVRRPIRKTLERRPVSARSPRR